METGIAAGTSVSMAGVDSNVPCVRPKPVGPEVAVWATPVEDRGLGCAAVVLARVYSQMSLAKTAIIASIAGILLYLMSVMSSTGLSLDCIRAKTDLHNRGGGWGEEEGRVG